MASLEPTFSSGALFFRLFCNGGGSRIIYREHSATTKCGRTPRQRIMSRQSLARNCACANPSTSAGAAQSVRRKPHHYQLCTCISVQFHYLCNHRPDLDRTRLTEMLRQANTAVGLSVLIDNTPTSPRWPRRANAHLYAASPRYCHRLSGLRLPAATNSSALR